MKKCIQTMGVALAAFFLTVPLFATKSAVITFEKTLAEWEGTEYIAKNKDGSYKKDKDGNFVYNTLKFTSPESDELDISELIELIFGNSPAKLVITGVKPKRDKKGKKVVDKNGEDILVPILQLPGVDEDEELVIKFSEDYSNLTHPMQHTFTGIIKYVKTGKETGYYLIIREVFPGPHVIVEIVKADKLKDLKNKKKRKIVNYREIYERPEE